MNTKNIKKHILAFVLVYIFYPSTSYAQHGIVDYLNSFRVDVLSVLPRFLFGLSVVYFFWGTSQFVLNAGEEKLREDGKQKMIWGVVALFVFASIGGILRFLSQILL